METYVMAFCSAALASLFLTFCVRELAKRRGWVDRPDLSRKLHAAPTPRIGGIAIYLSLCIALGLVWALGLGTDAQAAPGHRVLIIVGLAGLMMILGLWDDLRPLSPYLKFLIQTLLAFAAWWLGFRILAGWSYTGAGTTFSYDLLSLPLTLLWIVGVTNAFNLIDGLDGLSAGAALFATVSLVVVSFAGNNTTALLPLAALAGAIVGFLRYNFNPASIFLGDSGSLLLGFTLSLLSIEGGQKSPAAIAIGIPVVAFGLPLVDTALVMVRRFLTGKPLFKGDRRHIHHALMDRGLTPRAVVVVLYGVCAMFGFFSLWFLNPSGRAVGLAMTILGVCVWIGIKQLNYPELREVNAHFTRGTKNMRKLIAGSVAVGKLVDNVRAAGTLGQVLSSLSVALEELGFSCVEIRVPFGCGSPGKHDWSCAPEPGGGTLLRWNACDTDLTARGAAAGEPFPDTSTDFRVEIPVAMGESAGGCSAGLMTFHHPATDEYPVSAVCLLSRNVWLEFDAAFARILAQSPIEVRPSAHSTSSKRAGAGT